MNGKLITKNYKEMLEKQVIVMSSNGEFIVYSLRG